MRTASACLAVLACSVSALRAQDGVVTLVIQRSGQEVGREQYRLQATARRVGTSLTTTARYPATNPVRQVSATLERTPESGISKFELDVQGPEGPLVILAAGSGTRLIVRSVTRGAEAGREMPGGRDIVLLDEAVHALYLQVAELATPAGARLTAVFPRTGRRAAFTARREAADGGGARLQLAGEVSGTLVTDAQGHIVRLELPGSATVVTRASK